MNCTTFLNGFCVTAILSTGAVFSAGCGDDDRAAGTSAAAGGAAEGATVARETDASLGPEISVSGCLTANLDGGSYALTPTDTAPSSADRSRQMPVRQTVTYELVGNVEDFRRYANTMVTARGREDSSARRESDVEREDESEQRPAAGTSGTPTVETKEEVELNVRRLHVASVVANGSTCPSMGDQSRPSTQPAARPQTQP